MDTDVVTEYYTRVTLKCLRIHKDHGHLGNVCIQQRVSECKQRRTETNRANNRGQFVFCTLTNQRVLLPGGQVQGCVVQAVHKVPQAGYVHLVLYCLGRQHTQDNILSRVVLFSKFELRIV